MMKKNVLVLLKLNQEPAEKAKLNNYKKDIERLDESIDLPSESGVNNLRISWMLKNPQSERRKVEPHLSQNLAVNVLRNVMVE